MNVVKIKPNVVKFSEIEVGKCFEYDGNVYLKINAFYEWTSCSKYNTINLNNSCFDFFDDRFYVFKVNATLSINYSMEE